MSNNKLETMRHSCSHALAAAVLEMFPDAKLAIGPAIDEGFYYDFELPRTLIPEDLKLLEEKMKKFVKEGHVFEQYDEPIDQAIAFLKKVKQPYKVEMAGELKEKGEKKISFYKSGNFVDMCAGPHVENTKQIGAFQLTTIAGAYWRGDEKNKMLQRIYGICFATPKDLKVYLNRIEEAKKRDHRELGKKLKLFSFHDEGPGFPFWQDKGMKLRSTLVDLWRKKHRAAGYKEIQTPLILNESLWHQSGHWDHYQENMYFTKIDEQDFALKPMNCPGGMLMYKEDMHSYRELPLRVGELGTVHRHEKSGVLHGLLRVRSFTQDDAHIFCTKEQVKEELKGVIKLTDEMYSIFGFDYRIELSTRPAKSIGSDEIWEMAESTMKEVLDELGVEYKINEGDGAFYGPKFDFHVADAIGRTWQCGTLQLDFSMPERFELEYVGEDGESHRPVMLHRVVYGSLERFIAILIEHYAGAFPVWLAPLQVMVIPVSEKHFDYAAKVMEQLQLADIRSEIDYSMESIGKKIRNAELQKVPYMLVVGDKEIESGEVNVRSFADKSQTSLKLTKFVQKIEDEVKKMK